MNDYEDIVRPLLEQDMLVPETWSRMLPGVQRALREGDDLVEQAKLACPGDPSGCLQELVQIRLRESLDVTLALRSLAHEDHRHDPDAADLAVLRLSYSNRHAEGVDPEILTFRRLLLGQLTGSRAWRLAARVVREHFETQEQSGPTGP